MFVVTGNAYVRGAGQYFTYQHEPAIIVMESGDPSYSGYRCSKPPRGTGGSREPPVPVKGVQAILAIGGSREVLG